MNLFDIYSILACPDDGQKIEIIDSGLVCTSCKRKFHTDTNFIDILPKKFTTEKFDDTELVYSTYYKKLMNPNIIKTFGLISKSVPLGFVNETINFLRKYIKLNQIVCDVGAGGGDYSINLAKNCRIMLHCDLDLNGIMESRKKAAEQKLNNIIFLRCNYFKLPFQNDVIDTIYFIDIIERGIKHDEGLLEIIKKTVKKKGLLLFDCHASERYRLTHSKNLHLTTYLKTEMLKIIKKYLLEVVEIEKTGHLPQLRNWSKIEYKLFNSISKKLFLPPARWIFCVRK